MRTFFYATLTMMLLATACFEGPRVSILVQGAPMHGANGIRFDAQDRLHVASVFSREIIVMDPDSGEILERLGPEQGVEGPDDLTFGPDGSLYWTAIITGEVGRRTPDGRTQIIGQPGLGVNPIAMSDDGRLFVARCFFGDGFYEIDPEGVEEPREIIAQLGGGCGFNAFDFGPDGYLYAPGFFRDEIVRVDVDAGDTTLIADGFGIPNALKFDAQGRLHALDSQRGEVLRVDVETGEKELLATLKPNLDNLAFDSHDRLFVSSADDSAIVEVLPGGGTRTVSPSGLSKPGGIAAIGDSLWVADHYALVELDARTGAVRSYQTSIIGVSELAEPLTVSPYGQHLLLSSHFTHAVQVWDPQQGRAVATYEDFITPVNAIAHRKGIVVAEALMGRVSLLDETGEVGVLADGFELPIGLASRGDALYVGDFLAGTVTRIGPEGERTTVVEDLAGPEGIALTADGTLLVVEARKHRLLAVDLQAGEKTIVAADLGLGLEGPDIDLTLPTLLFNGVTVAADGTIYLTGDIDNVVIRVDL